MALKVVIPAAGLGTRFRAVGYTVPKPFIRINGVRMIDYVMHSLPGNLHWDDITVVTLEENQEYVVNVPYNVCFLPKLSEGALETVSYGALGLDPEDELLVVNSDNYVDPKLVAAFVNTARNSELDGSLLVFDSSDNKWSYAAVDPQGLVTQVAEKTVISNHATAGYYYFRWVSDFRHYAALSMDLNIRTNGEFYLAPIYNIFVEHQKRIGIYQIKPWEFVGLGTPAELLAGMENLPHPTEVQGDR